MKLKTVVSYLLIIVGGIVAIYANANLQQHVIILILGIVALMAGLFSLNTNLTSKPYKNDYNIQDEEE